MPSRSTLPLAQLWFRFTRQQACLPVVVLFAGLLVLLTALGCDTGATFDGVELSPTAGSIQYGAACAQTSDCADTLTLTTSGGRTLDKVCFNYRKKGMLCSRRCELDSDCSDLPGNRGCNIDKNDGQGRACRHP